MAQSPIRGPPQIALPLSTPKTGQSLAGDATAKCAGRFLRSAYRSRGLSGRSGAAYAGDPPFVQSGDAAADEADRHPHQHGAWPDRRGRGIREALADGWIAGAALDDIEEEPAKQQDWHPANPLFQLHNVIITPHAAYYSEDSIGAVRRIAAEEAVRVLSGLPALSPVNTIAA